MSTSSSGSSYVEPCLADSLYRAAGFVVDQSWIDFVGLALLAVFPHHNKRSATQQFIYAVAATFIMCALKDICKQYMHRSRRLHDEERALRERRLLDAARQAETW